MSNTIGLIILLEPFTCGAELTRFNYVNIMAADAVVCDTECSPERVALQMPGSIAQECAGASLATAGVSTQEWVSLCVWHRWVWTSWVAGCRRPWVALSGLREWPWVGPEDSLRQLWSATIGVISGDYVRPVKWAVCCDLWVTVPDGVVRECIWTMARAGSNGACLVS